MSSIAKPPLLALPFKIRRYGERPSIVTCAAIHTGLGLLNPFAVNDHNYRRMITIFFNAKCSKPKCKTSGFFINWCIDNWRTTTHFTTNELSSTTTKGSTTRFAKNRID
ncbi:hypothetical protein V1478_016342 [Vespula squamosa]|uniref:Uncharacterized protein n=1 Tax=Vespula squamosa TaxID=30214 RepID=A0ABD2A1X7_VESSQ